MLVSGIEDNDLSEGLKQNLESDVFRFSQLKTNAQLFEAAGLLTGDKKQIKSFTEFSKDVLLLKTRYNENYLEAEYEFAVGSSLMASQWENYGNSDRYYLQYRTANDDRVRDSHRVLHNITLPKNDSFWDYYFAPNGWRCRCNVRQVLASNNPLSDSKAAIKAGEKATTKLNKKGKNTLGIFRFNPGKKGVVFPPKHPYNKVAGANKIKTTKETETKPPKFTPKNIEDYEKKFKTKIDKSFFKWLTKETTLTEKNLNGTKKQGAYYSPNKNYVKIPYSDRAKKSKWYRKGIIYHEFGHAADWHNNIRQRKEVSTLMNKYRKIYHEKKNKKFIALDKKLMSMARKEYAAKNWDKVEKATAALDTIMSLDPDFGFGHSKDYFKLKLKKEAEFIAHAFENKYAGNNVFKAAMPNLYSDMVKLIEKLEPKQ